MSTTNRFTGRQITTMVVAACLALVLLPVGAFAASSAFTTIADPVHSSQKARVSKTGQLATAPCDANSCASVDGSSLRVGDGHGPLTVNGSVLPYPNTAFSAKYYLPSLSEPKIIKPGLKRGSKIMITSITVMPFGISPSYTVDVVISKNSDPGKNCSTPNLGGGILWDEIAKYPQPFGMSFPSPVVVDDRCAVVANAGGDQANVTITGYVIP